MTRNSQTNTLCDLVAAAAFVAGLLLPCSARADQAAPAFVQERFGLSCTPECTLCHSTSPGNYRLIRTVNGKSFIDAIKRCGFDPIKPDTWPTSFQACETNPMFITDTDGDGTPDMQELWEGTDPSDPTPGAAICGGGPSYGCVRVARGTSVDGIALMTSSAVLLVGIALMRRRRSGAGSSPKP
jgi:hypothetical protein